MTGVSIPTLSTLGYAKNPPEMAKKLIEYYNESNASQSTLFFGMVYSLAERIVAHGTDAQALSEAITSDLTKMFAPFFNDTSIQVKVVDNKDGTYNLMITGTYTDQSGTPHQINEAYKKGN